MVEMKKTKRSRPHVPGYGIPKSKKGLLTWAHVCERMSGPRNYWVGTTRPDGRPHAVPVWGVWIDETFYHGGGPDTRKARNITVAFAWTEFPKDATRWEFE